MLTAEQVAVRRTGIGASEASALLTLNPYAAPIDVWLRKPTASREPLVIDVDTEKTEVGSFLEDGVRALYEHRTKRRMVAPHETLRHPTAKHVLASPDGIGQDERRGLEIKVVGRRMAHHWENETVPDYVLIQACQNMAVTGLPLWDVAVLIGTDFRVVTIERDTELEAAIVDTCEYFWAEYIEGDKAPPIDDPEDRARELARRYPGSEKQPCRDVTGDAAALAAIQDRMVARAALEAAELASKDADARLLEIVGNDYGIEGTWGRYIAPAIRGRVDWKGVLDELVSSVPHEVIERYRGEGFRSPRFYPPKKAK